MPKLQRILLIALSPLLLGGCMGLGSIAERGTAINEGSGEAMPEYGPVLLSLDAGEPFRTALFLPAQSAFRHLGVRSESRAGISGAIGSNLTAVQKAITVGTGGNALDNTTSSSFQHVPYISDFYAGLLALTHPFGHRPATPPRLSTGAGLLSGDRQSQASKCGDQKDHDYLQ